MTYLAKESDWDVVAPLPTTPRWMELAARLIRQADVFVFLATYGSLDSAPCIAELGLAVLEEKPVICIDLEGSPAVNLHNDLRGARQIDGRHASPDAIASALHAHLRDAL
jgi:nucleoside 2-deoxyribosyltransferase